MHQDSNQTRRRSKAHLLQGYEGEQLALLHLKRLGYRIICRNYRCPIGEIDIIAQHQDVLVFVEVKSRTTKWIENLAELVSPKQRKLLVQAADHYLVSRELDHEARFDIITIFKTGEKLEIEHLEDAFYHF